MVSRARGRRRPLREVPLRAHRPLHRGPGAARRLRPREPRDTRADGPLDRQVPAPGGRAVHPQAFQAVPALEPHRRRPRPHARAQAHGTQAGRALHRQDVAHRSADRRRAHRRRRRLQPPGRLAARREGAGGDHRDRRPELPHHGHVELPARRRPGHGLARRRADAQRRMGSFRAARRQARQGAAHRLRGRPVQRLAREALAAVPRRLRSRRLRHDQRGLVPADGGRQRAAGDVPPGELDARQHHRRRGGRHSVGLGRRP